MADKHKHRGVGDKGDGDAFIANPSMPEPTDAPIRSERKILALTRRAELRQCLWHPDDSQAWERIDDLRAGQKPAQL